jgi:hypothetical protein
MYGLKQAGILANQLFTEKVETFWLLPGNTYAPPMFAQYETYGIQFTGR